MRTERRLELPSGIHLPYVEQGDPDGLPVLCLHGVTDSWRSFTPVLPLLPPALRVIAVTQRGHRGASRPASGYGLDALAGDAIGVLDALGIDAAVVVGHSMGATVAQRLAVGHPRRVRGLLLMGAFAGMAHNQGAREMWQAVSRLADPVPRAFARDFQLGTVVRPLPEAFLEMVVNESLTLPASVWRALFAGFLADDQVESLARITAPTVVVWGDRDVICPRADQDALLRTIPGATLVVVPDAGHAVHWEVPSALAEALATFASAVGRSTPPGGPRFRAAC